MKLLLTAFCLLMATTSFASDDYCKKLHSTRDRLKTTVNWPAYKQCIEAQTRQRLENELLQSEIELNKQKAEWYLRHRNNLNYRGFPCEEVKNGRQN